MEFVPRRQNKSGGTDRLQTGRPVSLIGMAALLFLAAGCAANRPSVQEPVEYSLSVAEKQTIARVGGGRTGFVITETPDPSAAWRSDFERAVALLQEGQDAEAVPVLEQIVEQSPGVSAPYINLARAYRHTAQYEQAETQLQTALELVPEHPVASHEYGLLLRQTGRFAEAREVYEATLQRFPDYLPVRLNLGILCELYLKDNACAVEHYTLYSEADPGNQTVPIWLADLNLRMGRD